MGCVDFSKTVEYTIFMAKNGKKNQTGIALACWILGLLILIIVFFVKQEEIVNNLKTTQFFERIFGVTPEFIKKFDEVETTKDPNSSSSLTTTLQDNPTEIKIEYSENNRLDNPYGITFVDRMNTMANKFDKEYREDINSAIENNDFNYTCK